MKLDFTKGCLTIIASILILICGCSNVKKTHWVIGKVTNIELVIIHNMAKDKPERQETKITLDLIKGDDETGNPIEMESYEYPIFAGSPNLKTMFYVGDTVKIVCTSATGRHIKSIEKLN